MRPVGHRLAPDTNEPLPFADLAGEAFSSAADRRDWAFTKPFPAHARNAGFTPMVVQEGLPVTLSLIAAALGVSVVPASMRRFWR
ncbi:MAG: hypothetical protein JO122_05735 [Acetobacteraceae bacterium]|nr:hypothetical protein [Acetobacteraceae bacterium]